MICKREKCKRFSECSAPLCPLMTEEELRNTIWYPDEEICPLREYKDLIWIRNQKKIKKKAKDETTYFTYDMLNRRFTIRKGIKGINPNCDIEEARKRERKWIEKHPEISEERYQAMKERAKILNTEKEKQPVVVQKTIIQYAEETTDS